MSIRTYEGRVEKGQIRLKDAPVLTEGMTVYVVIPDVEGTAFDPNPVQIAADVRTALAEFSTGQVLEIQDAEELMQLVNGLDAV